MSGLTSGLTTLRKRTLLQLTRIMEDQCLGAYASPEDTVCFTLFQHALHFGQESRRLGRLARRTAAHVVAFEGHAGLIRPPLVHVPLGAGDPLTQEWTFVVVGTGFGAHLVARDGRTPASCEGDRLFEGRFSYLRHEAVGEARRLRRAFAASLPPATLATIDRVLQTGPATTAGSWPRSALHMAVQSFDAVATTG